MTVVNFPVNTPEEKEEENEYIWCCSCGCVSMFLMLDVTIRCASCNESAPVYKCSWADFTKAKESFDKDNLADAIHIERIGELPELAMKRQINGYNDPGLLASTQIFEDGRVSTFIRDRRAETDEQKAWWRRRAVEFLRHIF